MLSYEVIGRGKPIVLLHGFTGCTRNWQQILRTLRTDYQVIAIDIIGHGNSPSPNDVKLYRMEKVAEEIVAVWKSIIRDPIHLLGYSMGGRLALYLALHYPHLVHSLTLESASPGLRTQEERDARIQQDNALATRILNAGIAAFVDYWESIPLFHSQEQIGSKQREWLRQQRLTNNPIGLANSLRGMGTGQQPNLWDDLHNLPMPTHLIVGEYDTKFTQIAQQMEKRMKHSKRSVIQKAGHTVHFEQPQAHSEYVLAFLNENS